MSRQVIENETEVNIPEDRRCVYRFADGRRCRVRRWGAELCFHHDPAAAEKRKNRGRYFSRLPILTATEINELLLRTLKRLEAGEISAGQAYAQSYLAQLLLQNLPRVRKEFETAHNQWEGHVEEVARVRALTAPAEPADQGGGEADPGRESSASEAEETPDRRA